MCQSGTRFNTHAPSGTPRHEFRRPAADSGASLVSRASSSRISCQQRHRKLDIAAKRGRRVPGSVDRIGGGWAGCFEAEQVRRWCTRSTSCDVRGLGWNKAEPPETRYARLENDRIAYQLLGEGPPDLLWVGPWISHIDGRWEDPCFRDLLRRIARFSRLIAFDKRGSGASDRFPAHAAGTWQDWVQDVRAVMRAAGSSRAVVCGVVDGGPVAALFAATYPELVSQLVLVNTAARFTQTDDYPWGGSDEVAEAVIDATRENGGTERSSI
jgi:hypothetical protein